MNRKSGLVRVVLLRISIVFLCAGTSVEAGPPGRQQVLDAMTRATDFMMNTVSNRGGFVWAYSLELEPFGELPARKSMIWVEPPGTPSVGIMLLEAYKVTGDDSYLDYAKRVAEPLIEGQHPSGGWNYFIDFDPAGLQDYYDNFFSKCWGWQEYLHNYGNCTFDDFSTTEPTRFLLRLYEVTRETKYQEALNRALDHIVRAQYSNGAWPQRYPTGKLFPREDLPDYTPFYTFNDGVMLDNIKMLLEAHAALGDPRFQIAARKGMDFYLLAQLPETQAGWAQQYNFDLEPAWGRPFEIGTVCAGETVSNIQDLMLFYRITGDPRYLKVIPPALDWLERSTIPGVEGYTHTYYYERSTNRPQYIRQTGKSIDDVRFEVTDEVKDSYPYGNKITIPVEALRREYERVRALSSDAARAEYELSLEAKVLPAEVKGGYLAKALSETTQSMDGIAAIVDTMDDRGGWRETVEILDPFSPFTKPPRIFEGYTTGGYIGRMYRLINYLDKD
jgi:PelA/Pel-15E family pectate lyase